MKLLEIIEMYNALSTLSKSKVTFPAVVNNARRRNANIIKPIFDDFNETRDELVKTYGEPEDETKYKFTKEGRDKFNEELTQLLESEVSADVVKFSSDILSDKELEPSIYDALATMFDD